MILYHGTTPEGMEKIPKEGFSLESARVSDPGDFGWGIYLTGPYARAKAIGGKNVLTVEVNLDNPLRFSTMSDAYKWREALIEKYGDTIHGIGETFDEKLKNRFSSAKKWTEHLLKEGYDGIIIYDPKIATSLNQETFTPYEVVVFKPEKIRVVSIEKGHLT